MISREGLQVKVHDDEIYSGIHLMNAMSFAHRSLLTRLGEDLLVNADMFLKKVQM